MPANGMCVHEWSIHRGSGAGSSTSLVSWSVGEDAPVQGVADPQRGGLEPC